MDAANQRRLFAYPAAAAIVGTLVWAGFVREVEPDVGTLLGCADTQLQLAAGIATGAKQSGNSADAEELVENILVEVEDYLARAEKVAPGHPHAAVLRGDVCSVRGDVPGTKRHYEHAASLPDCSPEGRIVIRLRLTQMLADAGETDSAVSELAKLRSECARDPKLSQFETDIESIEFDVLLAAGDRAGAVEIAARLSDRGAIDASTRAGELFEQLGDSKRAEDAYSHPAMPTFVSEYCRARLKAKNGEIDTALELLESALTEAREDVLVRIRKDREAWATCRSDTRFKSLVDRPEQLAQPAR